MPAPFQLRTPSLDDLIALAELGKTTFIETFGHLYQPEDLQAFLTKVYSEEAIAKELNNPDLHFQVLAHEEDFIGFAKIGPVHVPVENFAPGAMELWQLYVRQEFIGQGLGRKLMAWAEEQFKAHRASEIYVSVFSENERAIQFYESHGFRKVGDYGFPVGEQIDLEWIMLKV
ncbi:GNAT family N-acetyltransferase [Akkermansiaceae bacterium]|nr:GNAT family N-acetyltransferase [Akkermansiaceae bacterium]